MFSSRVGHDAQHRVDGNRVRWQSHTSVPVSDKAAMNTEGTPKNKIPVAGDSSNGLLPPASDSQQRGIWVDYASPGSQKATSGFDCPIRVGPDGCQKCGWRPRDGTDGFTTMSRVREHVAFHGLICPDCGNCFRASKKWKQHRDYRKRTGECLKCGYDTSKPQHPLELDADRIDHFFKSQPQNGPVKQPEEMWLEGFMALFPNWREHFTELPSALYRLNVQREAEAQTKPNLNSSPISSGIASPCAAGSQCPESWSQEGMDPGSVMSLDEMLEFDISENGIPLSTPTAFGSQQDQDAGYESFPWDASSPQRFQEQVFSPVIPPTQTSLPTINPDDLSNPREYDSLQVPARDQNSIARRLSDSAQAAQGASASKDTGAATASPKLPPTDRDPSMTAQREVERQLYPGVNDIKTAPAFANGHSRGVTSFGSQESSGGISQPWRKLTAENEKLHARIEELENAMMAMKRKFAERIEELESAMAAMKRKFAAEIDNLYARIKELERVPARMRRKLKNLVFTFRAEASSSQTPEERRRIYTGFVNDVEAVAEEDDGLQR